MIDYYSQEVGSQPVDFYSEEIQKKIPNHENFLQRVVNHGRDIATSMTHELLPNLIVGGPSGAGLFGGAGTKYIEKGLPSALQIAGSTAGSATGGGWGGVYGGTAGRAIGEGSKIGIENLLRGGTTTAEQAGENVSKQAMSGFGSELLGLGTGKVLNKMFFQRPVAEATKKTLGPVIGGLKEEIGKKVGSLGSGDEVIKPVSEAIANLKNRVLQNPEVLTQLKSIEDDFITTAAGKEAVDFRDVTGLRGRLDQLLKSFRVYGQKSAQQFVKGPKRYDEVAEVVGAREGVNKLINELAQKAGLGKEFGKTTSEYAKASKYLPRKHFLERATEKIPLAGISGISKLVRLIANRPVYQTTKAVGKVAPAGIASLLQQLGQ